MNHAVVNRVSAGPAMTNCAPPPLPRWLEKSLTRSMATTPRLPIPRGDAEVLADDLRAALEPAGPEAVGVMLFEELKPYSRPENFADVMKTLAEELEPLPADLLAAAFKRHRMTCKWFPKPSELRAHVADDLARRRMALWKIEEMMAAT